MCDLYRYKYIALLGVIDKDDLYRLKRKADERG